MARTSRALTARETAALRKRPGTHCVGDNLYLQVKGDNASWLLRYMLGGRSRGMGLGSFENWSLAQARDRAKAQRQLLDDSIDPIETRRAGVRAAALAAAKSVTFRQVADEYVADNRAGWKNAKHAAQWDQTLATYIYPTLGNLPIQGIDKSLVIKTLRPIWTTKPETARRVRGRIAAIIDWAIATDRFDKENPAQLRLLKKGLAAQTDEVEHHAALPDTDLPAFMAELRASEDVAARALEFTVLTAARTGEVIGATWREINISDKLWTIPKERMKAKREHIVPLSPRALEILKRMQRDKEDPDAFVFPGRKAGEPLSNMTFLMIMRRARPGYVPHGLRSTFSDWAGESTSFDRQTIEFALAHGISDKTEAAYRRKTALEKRARLMELWATHCASPVADTAKVVPIRAS